MAIAPSTKNKAYRPGCLPSGLIRRGVHYRTNPTAPRYAPVADEVLREFISAAEKMKKKQKKPKPK